MAEVRLSAAERMQRLLAILRYAAADADGVPIEAICERFAVGRGQLLKELDTAMMIGADSANFHDMPFEVFVDGDLVHCRLFGLERPLRLTPQEGFALLASAGALAGDDESSPLRRGLLKVAAALGVERAEALAIDVSPLGGPTGQLLAEAAEAGQQVRFDYWSYATDEVGERRVDPWRVFEAGGAWYLIGADHDRGDTRRFRIDRISDPLVLAEPVSTPAPRRLDPSVELPAARTAVLDLPPHARWVAEAYPVTEVAEQADGRLRVTLPVAGRSWLERLVLRLGEDAAVVSLHPDLGDADVAAGAARRILARYRGADRGN